MKYVFNLIIKIVHIRERKKSYKSLSYFLQLFIYTLFKLKLIAHNQKEKHRTIFFSRALFLYFYFYFQIAKAKPHTKQSKYSINANTLKSLRFFCYLLDSAHSDMFFFFLISIKKRDVSPLSLLLQIARTLCKYKKQSFIQIILVSNCYALMHTYLSLELKGFF